MIYILDTKYSGRAIQCENLMCFSPPFGTQKSVFTIRVIIYVVLFSLPLPLPLSLCHCVFCSLRVQCIVVFTLSKDVDNITAAHEVECLPKYIDKINDFTRTHNLIHIGENYGQWNYLCFVHSFKPKVLFKTVHFWRFHKSHVIQISNFNWNSRDIFLLVHDWYI